MPRRSDGGVSVHVSGAAVPAERPAPRPRPAVASRTSRARRSKATLVARRRRLFLGLLALTFFTMLLAVTGVMSWILQIVLDLLLVAFVAHLRAQAKRATVSRQRRRPPVAPSPRRPAGRPAAPQLRRQPAPAAAPAPAPARPAEEAFEATGTDDNTWEPVPVPRPAYRLKPPAPVEVPSDVIDPLRDTDPYNTMALYDEAPGSEVIAAEPEIIESDLDEILERRWAVND